MKIVVASVTAFFSMSIACHADPLTVGECLSIMSSLDLLDHYDDPVTGKPRQYKLGKARLTIALNMAALRHVREAVETTRTNLVQEIGNGGDIKTNTPEYNKFSLTMRDVLLKPCDVTPGHLKLSELKLGDGPEENAIAPSILSALAPILDQD